MNSIIKQYQGLALIVIGATLLIACFLLRKETNIELLAGLLIIIIGIKLHVRAQKNSSQYSK